MRKAVYFFCTDYERDEVAPRVLNYLKENYDLKLSGVILSIGRVIGESAAILLTAGTVAKMPLTVFDSARTLTVHAYLLTKETGDIQTACGVGLVLIVIVFALNTIAKLVAKKLNKANY